MRSTALWVACSVAAPQLPTSLAQAATPADSAPVRVEIADDMESPDAVRGWVMRAATTGLAQADVTGDTPTQRELLIRVSGEVLDYSIAIGVVPRGSATGELRTVPCKCSDQQLIERVTAEAKARAVELREPLDATPPPLAPQTPAPTTEPSPPAADTTADRRVGALGGAGIGLALAGVAGVVAGGVLLGKGVERRVSADAPERGTGIDNRKPGIAITAVGAAILLSGIAMIVVDQKRLKRRRTRAVGVTDGTSFGVVVTGKF